jgi:8-oxo-dGTP pyrophosphatase MutT (NUDIX family)
MSIAPDRRAPVLRVRGLIIDQGHILFAGLEDRSAVFFPGGRLEANETLLHGLTREIKEETGSEITNHRYLGAIEAHWYERGRLTHDLSHFFLVESSSLTVNVTPQCPDTGISLFWHPISALDQLSIKPTQLRAPLLRWLSGDPAPWWVYVDERV